MGIHIPLCRLHAEHLHGQQFPEKPNCLLVRCWSAHSACSHVAYSADPVSLFSRAAFVSSEEIDAIEALFDNSEKCELI